MMGGSGEEGKHVREMQAGLLYHAAGDERRARQALLLEERYALESRFVEKGDVDEIPGLAISQSMLGKHAAALASIDAVRVTNPESRDGLYGSYVSFVRSVILVRAGRSEEGYAEVKRLLHVPFGSPKWRSTALDWLLVKDDSHYDELINRPPRL